MCGYVCVWVCVWSFLNKRSFLEGLENLLQFPHLSTIISLSAEAVKGLMDGQLAPDDQPILLKSNQQLSLSATSLASL